MKKLINVRKFIEDQPPSPEAPALRTWAKDALFYPACGLDWEPLRSLSEWCGVFIYCDWQTTLAQFEVAVGQAAEDDLAMGLRWDLSKLRPLNPRESINPDSLVHSGLLSEEEKAAFIRARAAENLEPWGRKVRLTRIVEGKEHQIELRYLCCEGVTAYLELFAKKAKAPRFLCWKNCGAGFGGNWTDFRDYKKPLGRIVEMSKKKPAYIYVEKGEWPWHGVLPAQRPRSDLFWRSRWLVPSQSLPHDDPPAPPFPF